MTTLWTEQTKCVVCGKDSEQTIISSTITFGLPYLDLRPAPLQRYAIEHYIQKCPHCGYCAPRIFEGILEEFYVIKSDSYQKQLRNTDFPELVNSFLCYSLIEQSMARFASAGWNCLYAAWICDDANNNILATDCRKKAVILFQKAREAKQVFGEEPGVEEAIMADPMRRSGQFKAALHICDEGLNITSDKTVSDILHFQKTLIAQSDTKCHNVSEISPDNRNSNRA